MLAHPDDRTVSREHPVLGLERGFALGRRGDFAKDAFAVVPVKAALEAACRYLAYELGEKRIRVHPISPGPLKTRAASGLKDFDLLLNEAASRAPIGELVDIEDVGFTCAYLATPYARRLTGQTMYVDGGVNIMG